MTAATKIHPDKVRAYLATDYRIGHTAQDIVLTIGKPSERLVALFATNGVDCGAFLTAYNPQGTVQSDAANDLAHAELARKLQALGLKAIEGSGSEEGTDWPSEKSYFALGLKLEYAKELEGLRYRVEKDSLFCKSLCFFFNLFRDDDDFPTGGPNSVSGHVSAAFRVCRFSSAHIKLVPSTTPKG